MTIRASSFLAIAVLLGLSACGGGPTAMDVCKKLEAGGVAKDCQEAQPTGFNASAEQVASFEVSGLSGRTGVVLKFSSTNTYDATSRTYTQMGALNAEHRFGQRDRLFFVSLNEKTSQAVADKAKGIVDGL